MKVVVFPLLDDSLIILRNLLQIPNNLQLRRFSVIILSHCPLYVLEQPMWDSTCVGATPC